MFTMRLGDADAAVLDRLVERTGWSRADVTRKGWAALERLLPIQPAPPVLGQPVRVEEGRAIVRGAPLALRPRPRTCQNPRCPAVGQAFMQDPARCLVCGEAMGGAI